MEDHVEDPDRKSSSDEDGEGEEEEGEGKKRIFKKKTIAQRVQHRVTWSAFRMQGFIKKATQGEEPWEELNFIFVDAPWDFLRRITTPPPHPDMWYRRLAIIFPAPAVFFTCVTNGWFVFDSAPKWWWYVAEGVALIFSVIFYFTTSNAKPPRWIIVFATFFLRIWPTIAFLMSILWINWISNVLIDLLGLLGLMFGIPSAYLGITILAWGNSVGDTVANAGVAKRGLARMAITGCFLQDLTLTLA